MTDQSILSMTTVTPAVTLVVPLADPNNPFANIAATLGAILSTLGVTSIVQGGGITVVASGGTATISNAGVQNVTQGGGISLSGSLANVTIANSGVLQFGTDTGTIAIGTGLTEASGTLSLNNAGAASPGGVSVPTANGLSVSGGTLSLVPLLFGSGADGNVTISGTVALTRDMQYGNLTIASGAALETQGWAVFVAGTLDLTSAPAGGIQFGANAANSGSGSAAGAAPSAPATISTLVNGATGKGGGAGGTAGGTPGAAGGGSITGQAQLGGTGGSGGSGGSGTNSGAAGGTEAVGAPRQVELTNPMGAMLPLSLSNSTPYLPAGGTTGSSGGGGGGDGTHAGGGGGGSSNAVGVMAIYAAVVNRGTGTAVGAISVKGGAGGNGGSAVAGGTDSGGGGGAGGAGGGYLDMTIGALVGATATDAIDASGGTGGSGGTGLGSSSHGGSGGSGGATGGFCIRVLTPASITYQEGNVTAGNAGTAGTTGGVAGAGGSGGALQASL